MHPPMSIRRLAAASFRRASVPSARTASPDDLRRSPSPESSAAWLRRWMAAVACVLAMPAAAGAQTADTIAAAGLRADVAILRDALTTLHPGLYRYSDANEVEERFRALEGRMSRGRPLAEAYVDLAEFLAAIRCGHPYPNFFNQSRPVAEALLQRGRVPFLFRWIEGRMIVTRDLGGGGRFPAGAEVRAINGVAAGEILRRLIPLSRADGGNDAKRVANLDVRGDSRYEAFDVYYPLVFSPPAGEWTFTVVRPGAASADTVRAAPMTFAARGEAAERAGAAIPRDGPLWEFRWLNASTGYLHMPTWSTYNSRWDWKAWLGDVFAQLDRRGARDLVIDLRGNEGGTSVGDEILAHLTPRELTLGEMRRKVRYRRIPSRLRPYLDTWDRSFDDWGAAAGDFREGFYTLTRPGDAPGASVLQPAAPRFQGRAWVLVDASNSSATFEFSLAAQKNRLATLVGEPTGGNQRGINGGAFYFLRLPNSGIEVDLPLIGFFPPADAPDAGLTPDVLVRTTPADIARGVDPQLRAVLDRMNR